MQRGRGSLAAAGGRLVLVAMLGSWGMATVSDARKLDCDPTPCMDCLPSKVCDPGTLTCVDCGFGEDCTCPTDVCDTTHYWCVPEGE